MSKLFQSTRHIFCLGFDLFLYILIWLQGCMVWIKGLYIYQQNIRLFSHVSDKLKLNRDENWWIKFNLLIAFFGHPNYAHTCLLIYASPFVKLCKVYNAIVKCSLGMMLLQVGCNESWVCVKLRTEFCYGNKDFGIIIHYLLTYIISICVVSRIPRSTGASPYLIFVPCLLVPLSLCPCNCNRVEKKKSNHHLCHIFDDTIVYNLQVIYSIIFCFRFCSC